MTELVVLIGVLGLGFIVAMGIHTAMDKTPSPLGTLPPLREDLPRRPQPDATDVDVVDADVSADIKYQAGLQDEPKEA